MNLLLVDDDPKFRGFMQKGLQESGMRVETAGSGEQALELLHGRPSGSFDLLLLDVMLPKSSGWDVLEQLRKSGDPTPVIFLTARSAVEERVKGLLLGADDYVIKPFEFSELLARIEAVRRRHANSTKTHRDEPARVRALAHAGARQGARLVAQRAAAGRVGHGVRPGHERRQRPDRAPAPPARGLGAQSGAHGRG
jgi:DNA-binding response OmpR family regulator